MKKVLPLMLAVAGAHGAEPTGATLAELNRMIARFAPTEIRVDTSALSAGDRKALAHLIAAARAIDDIFLTQLWSGNHTLLAQLEKDKVELRSQLLAQFNVILQTRDTARGLIVNMSDVLFDTGKSSLRPLAREKLAKVAGIVSGHLGLRLDVEGHTDSVGGDEYNQTLSEQRGTSVRDYLLEQGMAVASVTTKGFGKTQPVASNDTADGRQQNRRVELVISGEVIGTAIGTTIIGAR